ncbi:MAG: flagellar export protein FliJ [Burkholderiales bacterium]|nr:flagellar export protein FliJ [Burkholderiales bacterium]
MLPKRTLQQLIEHAREKNDRAARALGATNSREREEHGKLDLLVNYRDECLARLVSSAREGMDRDTWLSYQRFVVKLDAAIEQQREQVALSRTLAEQSRSEWRAANGRLRSFDTLESRRVKAEAAAARRGEQRAQDEFASRKPSAGPGIRG